jgi:hypothetical protein
MTERENQAEIDTWILQRKNYIYIGHHQFANPLNSRLMPHCSLHWLPAHRRPSPILSLSAKGDSSPHGQEARESKERKIQQGKKQQSRKI